MDAQTAAEKIVRAGYGDVISNIPSRSLSFRVQIVKSDVDVIRLVSSYNEFDGDATADAVGAILDADAAYEVTFGRANSPVLHVWAKPGKLEQVRNILKRLNPGELDEVGNDTLRAWWD